MSAPARLNKADIMTVESNTVELLARADIDVAIATAHKFPRSISAFRQEAMAMVTLSETVASECVYALPRDGKTIEGPSARFAEVIASAWGNCRAGARIVAESGDFITAQGVFHDLQRNLSITFELQRRITDKNGRRFKPDMIGVTGNAACSIALRNAVLKGIPKAFWADMYEAARKTAKGDYKALATRRADAIKAFQGFGVTSDQLFKTLGVQGEQDISPDHLLTLRGLLTAIRDGETTPEEAFAPAEAQTKAASRPPRVDTAPPEEAASASPTPAAPGAIADAGGAIDEDFPGDLDAANPQEAVEWTDEAQADQGPAEADQAPAAGGIWADPLLDAARQRALRGAKGLRLWLAARSPEELAKIEPHRASLDIAAERADANGGK